METGGVRFAVYMYYIANMGLALLTFAIFFYTISQAFNSLSSIWLSKWSDASGSSPTNDTNKLVCIFFVIPLNCQPPEI